MRGILSFLAVIAVLTVFIFFVIVPMFSNNSDSNSGTGSNTFDKLVEDLNRDCDGEWGDCDQNTCNQTYTITTQSKGNGAKCPNKNGDTQTCSTGLCKDTTCDENGKSKNSKFCCNYGKPKDGVYPGYGKQQKCKENSCDSGYILDNDDICQPSYFCDHGDPVKGVVTIKNSDGKLVPIENCNSCKDGRVLVKNGDISTCNFSYTCRNGIKNSGSPSVGGVINCKSCNTGFSLTKSGKYNQCSKSSRPYDYLRDGKVYYISDPSGNFIVLSDYNDHNDKSKHGEQDNDQDVPCKPGSYSCGIKYLRDARQRWARVRLVSLNNNNLYRQLLNGVGCSTEIKLKHKNIHKILSSIEIFKNG